MPYRCKTRRNPRSAIASPSRDSAAPPPSSAVSTGTPAPCPTAENVVLPPPPDNPVRVALVDALTAYDLTPDQSEIFSIGTGNAAFELSRPGVFGGLLA